MSEPREEPPLPAGRPPEDQAAGRRENAGVERRPDDEGQDEEGGMPNPEYDMYRDIPGEREGG